MSLNQQIKFQDESHHYIGRKGWTDLEWVEELNKFLQGDCPKGLHLDRGYQPKLSAKKAMAVIWYLQEHMRILPDTIEKCDNCDSLFDANEEGIHSELKGENFCGGCDYLVPENYE